VLDRKPEAANMVEQEDLVDVLAQLATHNNTSIAHMASELLETYFDEEQWE
jgi:hypothetical protein